MATFKQNSPLFLANNSNVSGFIRSVGEFGDNFADVIEDLVTFFNAAKVFLNALADPITALLLPMLDSLIAALEDLKNIGVGTLSVWPWESGTKPPEFDSTKLSQGILALASYINHNVQVEFDQQSGVIVPAVTQRRSRLVTPDDIPIGNRTNVLSQDGVMGALNAVMTMLYPHLWKAEYPITNDVLERIAKFLNKRELTPSRFIDTVVRSFSDINDKDRPTGTGGYSAMVMFFALPSFSELTQILQTFADFFGGLLYDEVTRAVRSEKSDSAPTEIELGYPCVLSGTKNSSISAKLFYHNDATKRKDLPDKVYKSDSVTDAKILPMFQPGDIITQDNGLFNDFTAEVIEHKNIKIEGEQLASLNVVVVKNVRGKIKKSNSPDVGGSIVKKIGVSSETINKIILQKQINQLNNSQETNKVSDNQGNENFNIYGNLGVEGAPQNEIPMFFPGNSVNNFINIGYEFRSSITNNNRFLDDVFPVFSDALDSKFKSNLESKRELIYFDDAMINDKKFINEMVHFVEKKLKKGTLIKHRFIFGTKDILDGTVNKSEWVVNDFYDLRKLSKLIPSFGMTVVLKDIYIDDKIASFSNIEDALFEKDKDNEINIRMRKLSIELGRITADGIETEGVDLLVNVPGFMRKVWEHNYGTYPFYEVLKIKGGVKPPNWKFLRVHELFPIYGEVIDYIIDEVEGFRGFVKNDILLKLERTIQFLERMVKRLIELNNKIQRLLQALSLGFTGAGIYSAEFKSGGGVPNFLNQLKRSKIEYVAGQTLPTISLEQVTQTIEIENPVTGLMEPVTSTILKPSIVNPDRNKEQPEYVEFSELDHLKYCGGIVLFSIGSDNTLWDKFVSDYSTLETFGKSLISNLLGGDDTIVSKLKPYVHSIEVQDENNIYVSLDNRDVIANKKTNIKVNFTNNSDELTQNEINKLRDIQGRDVDVTPKLLQSTLVLTGTTDPTKLVVPSINDTVILYLGDNINDESKRIPFFINPGISETTKDGKQIYSVIFTPINNLKSTRDARYNVRVSANVRSIENVKMDDEYNTKNPFLVSQATIDTVEFI